MANQDSPRRIVGPNGRWKVTPAAETPEERQKHLDRIALANHLTGFVAPRMDFSQ
jgi:hypothetical protein